MNRCDVLIKVFFPPKLIHNETFSSFYSSMIGMHPVGYTRGLDFYVS